MAPGQAASGERRAPLHNIITGAALSLPSGGFLVVMGYYLPRHYVSLGIDGFGPGTRAAFLAVAAAISLTRVLDLLFDPLVALAMDRTKTSIGRYRPWTIVGVPILMLGVYKLFIPPAHVTSGYLMLYLVIASAGVSITTLGMTAWLALLTKAYNDRSRTFAIQYMMLLLGQASILFMPFFTHGRITAGMKSSMPTLGIILTIAFPIALAVTLLTPERGGPRTTKPTYRAADYFKALSRPEMLRLIIADLSITLGAAAVGPLYVYFWHDVKGFTVPDVGLLLIPGTLAGLLAPLWGRISRRIGKHWTLLAAGVAFATGQTVLMALPRVHAPYTLLDALPTIIGITFQGFCSCAFMLMIRSMVADVADEVKLELGQDFTSLLFSMVTTTSKIGASITVLIVFPMLALIGYNGAEGAANTPHAIFQLQLVYVLTPIILIGLGGVAMIGYRLDARRHAEIRARLEEREADLLPPPPLIGEVTVADLSVA